VLRRERMQNTLFMDIPVALCLLGALALEGDLSSEADLILQPITVADLLFSPLLFANLVQSGGEGFDLAPVP
jgi:hypothetical protein